MQEETQQDQKASLQGVPGNAQQENGYETAPTQSPPMMMVTMIPPNEQVERGDYSASIVSGFRGHGFPRRGHGNNGYNYGGGPWRGGGKNTRGRHRGEYGKQMRPQATCEGYSGEQLYKPSFSEDPWARFYDSDSK